MKFGYVGVRFNEAPLSVRELASFTDSKKISGLQAMRRIGVEQCMVLSTCNRSEIFFFCSGEVEMGAVSACYLRMFPDAGLAPYLCHDEGEGALSYLFRVAAGLESLVLGEDQILGQVREAADFSRTMGFCGKELDKIARDAVTCAKEIKTRLKISEKPLSIAYTGVQEVKKRINIDKKDVLVIGSGKTSSLALSYLVGSGAANVYVCSRNRTHAKLLKDSFPQISICSYEERYRVMERCSVVVSATTSPHYVVRREPLREMLEQGEDGLARRAYCSGQGGDSSAVGADSSREGGDSSAVGADSSRQGGENRKRRIFLDLAAPRDVEETVGELPGAELIDLDTLQEICSGNRRERERLAAESRAMIEKSVGETQEWILASRMDGTIESLQKRCADIVEDSFSYLDRKLNLESREKAVVRKVLNAALQRFLREPIQKLKKLDSEFEQEQYRQLIEQLFGTNGGDDGI